MGVISRKGAKDPKKNGGGKGLCVLSVLAGEKRGELNSRKDAKDAKE